MVSLAALVLVIAIGAFGYAKYRQLAPSHSVAPLLRETPAAAGAAAEPPPGSFRCDGRIHCSQMTSCREAKLFLRNCPGTKMDGNNDGVPCEQQWCTSPFAN